LDKVKAFSALSLKMDKLDRIGSGFLPGIIRRHTPSLQKNPSNRDSNNPKKSVMDAIPDHIRNHGIAMLGEGVGTFMFFFLAFSGTQVANTQTTDSHPNATDLPQGPNPSALMYIALVFGFSLAVNAWVFFRVSGGLFNPAVSGQAPVKYKG
jgi:glycerol uptake facilitator-like aquaporin